jgi:hypothetical protein
VFICFRFGERSVLTTSRPRRCLPRCRPRRCRTRRRGSPSRKAPTSSRTPTRRRSSRRTRRASSRRRRLSTSRRRRRGRTPPTPSQRGPTGRRQALRCRCICKAKEARSAVRSETCRCTAATTPGSAMIRRRNRKLIILMTTPFLDRLNCPPGK